MACKSFISGCASLTLSDDERAFFKEHRPVGLILFARNCANRTQVRALVDDYKSILDGDDVFVLIDQEGGRVARLTPPEWPAYPAARKLGEFTRKDAAQGEEAIRLLTQMLASDLYSLGINVDCLPVLDIPIPGADDIIGDRAYGEDVGIVSRCGRAAAEGLLAGGVLPVIKHIPGHGRASCDSHLSLPLIETDKETLGSCDFQPFRALNDMPMGMTAHIKLPAFDTIEVSSASKTVIGSVIRGDIGFDGVLMCDDLSMQALSGPMAERTRRVLQAGCDLALHCNGKMHEMVEVAGACGELAGEALRRVSRAFGKIECPQDFDRERAERLRLALLSS